MAIDYGKALKYPYRHCIAAMLVPGLIVYADIILMTLLAVLLVVAIAVLVSAFMPHADLAQEVSALFSNSPFSQSPFKDSAYSLAKGQPFYQGLLDWMTNLIAEASSGDYGSDSYDGSSSSSNKVGGLPSFNLSGGGQWCGIIYTLFWLGFEWQLFARWQTAGFDAPPPEPETRFGSFFMDGLKGAAFYIPLKLVLLFLLGLPLLVGVLCVVVMISGGMAWTDLDPTVVIIWIGLLLLYFLVVGVGSFFLAPFFIAPLIHSAQNRSIPALYDFAAAAGLASRHYGQVLTAFLLILVTWIIYASASLLICLVTCCTGMLLFPFMWEGAFRVTAAHLIAQAFHENTVPESSGIQLIKES